MAHSSKIVAITGATATGKTRLAIDLAKDLGGEIVNADSVQVYEGLDIGSAKPTREEQDLIRHHLVSYVKPDEIYSVGRFRKDCLNVVRDLNSNNVLPIIVGGSGLYLSSLFSGFFDDSWLSYDADDFMSRVKEFKSLEEYCLWASKMLEIVDPASSKLLAENDFFRRERNLSLSLSVGAPISILKKSLSGKGEGPGGLIIIWERDRHSLYKKIEERVNLMINNGLIDEVRYLIGKYGENANSLKAIGYSQVIDYLNQEKQGLSPDLEGLIKIIQRDTRRFAKRQLTWWRNQPYKLGWVDILNSAMPNSEIRDSLEVVDGALQGTYNEVRSILKCLIEMYKGDSFCSSTESSRFQDKIDNSNLVYICRVRCFD